MTCQVSVTEITGAKMPKLKKKEKIQSLDGIDFILGYLRLITRCIKTQKHKTQINSQHQSFFFVKTDKVMETIVT